jgi:CO dehydrogenase maturation factor
MAKAPITNGTNGTESAGAIHLTLQGKGGVGKSLIASILAQYLKEKGREVRCIDTDPVNRTFAQYGALAADRLNLRDEHNRIEQRAFDSLMERFLMEESTTFVVDNGASTFLPLWHYLLENSALDYLRQNGRRVYVHTVITGGQALLDTLNGFHELAQTTEERNIVVWVNEYFGRDVEEMIAAKLTFNEAIGTAKLPVMAKQRLKIVQRDLFEQLDRVPF